MVLGKAINQYNQRSGPTAAGVRCIFLDLISATTRHSYRTAAVFQGDGKGAYIEKIALGKIHRTIEKNESLHGCNAFVTDQCLIMLRENINELNLSARLQCFCGQSMLSFVVRKHH